MTTDTAKPARQRRMARPKADASAGASAPTIKTPSKLDQVAALLEREGGASVCEIMELTGWQQHSVRGAMAGALKKRGLVITSERIGSERRYRVGASA